MSSIKANKYIDLDQFQKDKNGRISWKNSVGLTVEFFYYNEKHIMEIIDYGNNSIKIKIDDMLPEVVDIQKVKNLYFDELFYRPSYIYNVGDIVDGVIVLEQLYIKSEHRKQCGKSKHYKCKCLNDGYEYIISEYELKKSKGCPVCIGKRVFVGVNDLATTNPDMMKFLLDKEDGHRYTRGSHKYIWTVCPYCGYKKLMQIESLVCNGGISCKKCGDGLSYPNKFAYNVFEQLKNQYITYNPEYSPCWAGRMRYDNYIMLKDGKELIIEMDGGFHYNEYGKRTVKNDYVKNVLAEEHGIKIIRVNCFYNQISNRFELIKDNFIHNLNKYFDLSNIDWDSANNAGVSNKLIEVVDYYNKHSFMSIQQIADHFNLSHCTIRNYIITGEELGLCEYIKNDNKRNKLLIPLILYNNNGDFIGVYTSAKQLANEFKDKDFVIGSIYEYSRLGKLYKGYIVKRITWDEYEALYNSFDDKEGI